MPLLHDNTHHQRHLIVIITLLLQHPLNRPSQVHVPMPQRVHHSRPLLVVATFHKVQARSRQLSISARLIRCVPVGSLCIAQILTQRQVQCVQHVIALLKQQAPARKTYARLSQTQSINMRRRERFARSKHNVNQPTNFLATLISSAIKPKMICGVDVFRRIRACAISSDKLASDNLVHL